MLQPEDIERFAMASRKIHILSGSVLLEHRKLTRESSHFHDAGYTSKASAAGLLKGIITNPHVALHVKSLAIFAWRERWENEEKGVNAFMAFDAEQSQDGRRYCHTPYAAKIMKIFQQAVKEPNRVLAALSLLLRH